jgi:hypothetical protein
LALALAAPAMAATGTYPAGGGEFNGGPEGWETTEASCDVPVLCSAAGGYEAGDGNPGGSMQAETDTGLNLVSLFHSTVTLQSPDFEVDAGGAASLHVDRRFAPGSLIDLAPRLDYKVQLIDRSSGKHSTSIAESVDGGSGWSGRDGAAMVVAGHTYAIQITARSTSTVVGTGLLAGSTTARFDNLALAVGTDGPGGSGGGKGGGSGANGDTVAARVTALAPATVNGPAQLKGKRLLVKVRCPVRIGRACRVAVRGLLTKRKPATAQHRVKVAKGKSKRLVLKVKPRAKGKLTARKRLLFKVGLRAGGAQATAFKRLRLLRR